jgi:hypothetical protein
MHANDFTDAIRNVFSDAKEGKNVNKTLIAGGHGRNNCSLYKTEETVKYSNSDISPLLTKCALDFTRLHTHKEIIQRETCFRCKALNFKMLKEWKIPL